MLTSAGTAQITAAATSMTVLVPTGGESWPSGSTQDLGWTLSLPVSVGQFGVWLVDQADPSKWYAAGFFSAVAAQMSYTPSFSTAGIPEGTYKVVVYYRTDPGGWMGTASGTSAGTVLITP